MTFIHYNSGMTGRPASSGQAIQPCVLFWILACAFLALPYGVPAAQLGFIAPRATVQLAEPFSVAIIAQFQPNEPAAWPPGACPAMSILAGWPAGIQVLSCTWNTAAWLFDTSGWEQSETNTAIWARGQARDPFCLTGAVTIANLTCIAREPDDTTFYFEIDPDPEFGSSMSILENGEIVDILGDPEDDSDGGDEIVVAIANTPGYILSLAPASSIIPLACSPVVVRTMLRPASKAAPYEHVRVELAYDALVFTLTNVAALCASVPPFFSAVEIHCPAGGELPPTPPGFVIITNRDEGELFVELQCAPTNYAGALFSWQLLPQSIEDNSELLLEFTDMDQYYSSVDRYGVDLLGMWDDAEDGVEPTDVSVRYVDGLRMFLEPTTPYGYVGSTTYARVMLAKAVSAPVQLDCLDVELFFDPALLACDSNAFSINPALAVSGQCHAVTLATNTFIPDPDRPDSLWYPWTAATARIQVNLPEILCVTQDMLWVGTLAFTPMMTGTIGFVRGDMSVTLGIDDLQDDNACGGGWPFALGVASASSAQRSVTIAFERDGADNASVKPGDRVSYSVVACGDALQDAAFDLRWIFDAAGLALQTGALVTSEALVIDVATTAVVRVHGTASTAATTCLARIQFTALKPGTMLLAPVSYALSSSAFCRITESGVDVLGAPGVPGDGVHDASITVANPELVKLVFEPRQTLFAGVQSTVALSLANPHATYWDTLSARILLDADSAILCTDRWETRVQNVTPSAFSSAITLVSNECNAALALQVAATNAAAVIASLPLIPLMDEVFWMFDTSTDASSRPATDVRFGAMPVMDVNAADIIDYSKWVVYPHGASIWIGDSAMQPVLGTNYALTVRVSNPNGVALQRVTFAYAFDATVMEVSTPVLPPGFSTNAGGVWISNSSDDGYICGDIWCDTITTARNVTVLQMTIRPKLNQVVELLPECIAIDDEREIGMGLWTAQQFNTLELFDEDPIDLCPEWHRGVAWLDIPQLLVEDQYLSSFESAFLTFDEILQNGNTNKSYKWWVEGATDHVTADISQPNQTLTLSSINNWTGCVQFRLCCQEIGSPYVGEVLFNVYVEADDAGDLLDIQMPRDEFIAAIGSPFDECAFTIVNATGAVLVSAEVTGPGMASAIPVELDNPGNGRINGRVVWDTSGRAPGLYRGSVSVRYSQTSPAVSATFSVELFSPGVDDDGDTYYLLCKGPNGRLERFTERTIDIRNGTDRDVLTMKVTRGPAGDGLVALDSIVSDHGMKKMQLVGMIHAITLNGPLGTLIVDGGSIGQLTVTRGGIGTVLVRTLWMKEDLVFADTVGILRGVSAAGPIKSIMVVGGTIGDPDAPALIRAAAGNIGSVVTLLKQRTYADGGRNFEVSCADGANICATIEAAGGCIGKVIAKGGSIGTPDGYPSCTLRASGDIGMVRATTAVSDGTPYGGSIFAAIDAVGAVDRLEAIGGDITRSEISEPDDISDSEHLPVRITARHIKSMKTLMTLVNYDGSKTAYGGTVHAVLNMQYGIDTITVVGGHACLLTSAAQAPGRIKSLQVSLASFKEYPDDEGYTLRGGDLISSAISTANSGSYKSSTQSDYHGPLLQLDVDGAIRTSWIGFAGEPTLPNTKFHYGLLENSEIWVNGIVCELPVTQR
ncbi:MAG: hypothetical protein NTV22_03895 [bacterium]|nr:hypothetical protein [bacterium]